MKPELGTVMLIDDEEIDQLTYQRVLKRSGMVGETLTFTYADDALAFLKANPDREIDVVFLDVNMPRMNGFEFLEAVSAQLDSSFARIVVVMLTTSLNPVDRTRAENHPLVRDFLSKPLSVDHISHVANLLAQSRAEAS